LLPGGRRPRQGGTASILAIITEAWMRLEARQSTISLPRGALRAIALAGVFDGISKTNSVPRAYRSVPEGLGDGAAVDRKGQSIVGIDQKTIATRVMSATPRTIRSSSKGS
jgi:hypothetical protein